MKKYFSFLLITVICSSIFFNTGCNSKTDTDKGEQKRPLTVEHWINWNLLFTTGSVGSDSTVIDSFENYVINFVHMADPLATISFKLMHCPCDPLLTNLDAKLVSPSGNPITPPKVTPNPGPSGDYTLAQNFEMQIPGYLDSNSYVQPQSLPKKAMAVAPAGSTFHRTLAIIDTGLDTLKFQQYYHGARWGGNLLWKEQGEKTLVDVVIGEDPYTLIDKGPVPHGTAVTAITLSEIQILHKGARIPSIMSIRAFDDSERGSIYTVSCALSYAIQQRADFINASFGYFGLEDSVLKHYLKKASDQSIPIIASAGNTPGKHNFGTICDVHVNDQNSLDRLKKRDSLFYPACFAPDIKNLVSVTQLNKGISPTGISTLKPCYYQNFSANYITVGAFEFDPPTGECCIFNIPFLSQPIEGSSFATPVVTAILISNLLPGQDIKSYILTNTHQGDLYTNKGDYFPYSLKDF